MFVYGFDDLARDQTELLAALAQTAPVTVAVTYADTRALAARAGLLTGSSTSSAPSAPRRCRSTPATRTAPPSATSTGTCSSPAPAQWIPTRGWSCSSRPAPAARRRRSGSRSPGCSPTATSPTRSRSSSATRTRPGRCSPGCSARSGSRSRWRLRPRSRRRASGTSLVALCRAAGDEGAVEALLTHLRTDPSLDPERSTGSSAGSAAARRPPSARRPRAGRSPRAISSACATPPAPPSACGHWRAPRASSPRAPTAARPRWRAVRRTRASGRRSRPSSCARGSPPRSCSRSSPCSASCPEPSRPRLADAIEALESATVPRWRGPADGRVRIMSPYRARAARARALFCAGLQEGEFPSAAPPDPLLSEERRAADRQSATCAAPTRPTRSATSFTPASRARPSAST